MDFGEGDMLQVSRNLDGVELANAEDVKGFALDLGDAGTLIDFGQGDSVLMNGVSYDEIMADPSRFITLV